MIILSEFSDYNESRRSMNPRPDFDNIALIVYIFNSQSIQLFIFTKDYHSSDVNKPI